MRVALFLLLAAISWAGDAFGLWKLNPALSTPVGNQRSVTLRIEPHPRGEVFTLDTVAADGRASTFSTILYFDGKAHGTTSSRRLDGRSVEILRECASGEQIRLVRKVTEPGVLVLEIVEQQRDGRRTERRLVMEKQ